MTAVKQDLSRIEPEVRQTGVVGDDFNQPFETLSKYLFGDLRQIVPGGVRWQMGEKNDT